MNARKRFVSGLGAITALFSMLLLNACGGGGIIGGGGAPPAPPQPPTPAPVPSPGIAGDWTWLGGSNFANVPGIYGAMGTAANVNSPGGRGYSTGWTDNNGNLWLFGGKGIDMRTTGIGPFNDLWEYDPKAGTWTWVSGSSSANIYGQQFAPGVYGTKGVPSTSNLPTARYGAVGWKDGSGNLWLWGGSGFTSMIDSGSFNDLWEFNITTREWTWVSGSDSADASGGVSGACGIPSADNVPSARGTGEDTQGAPAAWTDKNGNFWLFGGTGEYAGELNDLWEFNPATMMWTWNCPTEVMPAGRGDAVTWTDQNGIFWLFGGQGQDSPGTTSPELSDLWKFDPSTMQWTWISGSQTTGAVPNYGTKGVTSASNTPGARDSAASWVDSAGNLWLFGGVASDENAVLYFNDLWKFSPATNQWTWVGGSNTADGSFGAAAYGTLGVASASNIPGQRGEFGPPVAWTDSSGNFWLFGGMGNDSIGVFGDLNDLWRYQP